MSMKISPLMGAIVFGLLSHSASAQTLFLRPDTTPDYASYRHADECQAALKRTAKAVADKSPVFLDTAPFRSTPVPSLPSEAIALRQLCRLDVNVDTLPLYQTDSWVEDLLWMGRDQEVERLYIRLFDSVDASQYFKEIEKISRTFSRARPYFFDMERHIYQIIAKKLPEDSAVHRFFLHMKLMEIVSLQGKFDSVVSAIPQALLLADQIPESTKLYDYRYRMPAGGLILAMVYLNAKGWDSLSVSTSAYERFQRAQVAKIFPDPNLHSSIGLQVPSLKGDFWFQRIETVPHNGNVSAAYRKISPQVRPVPGKVNAIIFLQGGCHTSSKISGRGRKNSPADCLPQIAALRRAKLAFPELEITIVTNTFGNLGDAPPLDPSAEADTLADYFLGFHRIPGVQIVAKTPYFRLPGLDRRIIDGARANTEAYIIDGRPHTAPGSILLVDEDGYIFYLGGEEMMTGRFEEAFQMSIATVTKRLHAQKKPQALSTEAEKPRVF